MLAPKSRIQKSHTSGSVGAGFSGGLFILPLIGMRLSDSLSLGKDMLYAICNSRMSLHISTRCHIAVIVIRSRLCVEIKKQDADKKCVQFPEKQVRQRTCLPNLCFSCYDYLSSVAF